MKESEIISIINPTSEDFTWRYNGEPYEIKAGETKPFVANIACHLAKHLSTQMIVNDVKKKMTNKQRENRNDPIHVKIAQLQVYDTHERRIALYKIFQNEDLVLEVIKRYPFKGFIGEMDEYKKFVSKSKEVKPESSEN